VFWKNRKYFGKTFSVLPKYFLFCQNAFCVYLLGLFIHFGEKLFQGYIQQTEKLSRNPRLEENMESRPFFWCALSIAPPSPPIQCLLGHTINQCGAQSRTIHKQSTCAQAPMTGMLCRVLASGEMIVPMVAFKGARHGRIAARNICNGFRRTHT
jgi:hypothetical protein